QPVLARELPRADAVAGGDGEEALPLLDDVDDPGSRRRPGERARERAEGAPAGDAVGDEPVRALEAAQRLGRPQVEAPVDGATRQSPAQQPELERGDVPADEARPQLPLAEQRSPQRP